MGKNVIATAGVALLGVVGVAAFASGLFMLVELAADAYISSWLEEHGDEFREKVEKRRREIKCEMACMEGSEW